MGLLSSIPVDAAETTECRGQLARSQVIRVLADVVSARPDDIKLGVTVCDLFEITLVDGVFSMTVYLCLCDGVS